MKVAFWFFSILLFMTIGVGIARFVIDINKSNAKDIRIEQLENINKLLDTRGKTDSYDLTTTTTINVDDIYVDVLEEYNTAQKTYIDLLTGILRNNNIQFPEFKYEELLKENIQ